MLTFLFRCSNLNKFNYQPQTENHKQHLDLYMKRHLSLHSYHDQSEKSPIGGYSFKLGLQSDACRCATPFLLVFGRFW